MRWEKRVRYKSENMTFGMLGGNEFAERKRIRWNVDNRVGDFQSIPSDSWSPKKISIFYFYIYIYLYLYLYLLVMDFGISKNQISNLKKYN